MGCRQDHPGKGDSKKSSLLSWVSFLLLESLGKLWDNPTRSSGNAWLRGNSGSLEGPWSEGRPWNISSQILSSEHPGRSLETNPSSRVWLLRGSELGLPSSPRCSSCFCGYSEAPGHGAASAPTEKFQIIPRRRSRREPIQANQAASQEFQTGLAHLERSWSPGFPG